MADHRTSSFKRRLDGLCAVLAQQLPHASACDALLQSTTAERDALMLKVAELSSVRVQQGKRRHAFIVSRIE